MCEEITHCISNMHYLVSVNGTIIEGIEDKIDLMNTFEEYRIKLAKASYRKMMIIDNIFLQICNYVQSNDVDHSYVIITKVEEQLKELLEEIIKQPITKRE